MTLTSKSATPACSTLASRAITYPLSLPKSAAVHAVSSYQLVALTLAISKSMSTMDMVMRGNWPGTLNGSCRDFMHSRINMTPISCFHTTTRWRQLTMYQNSSHQFVGRKGGRGYSEWTESRLLVQVQLKVFLTTMRSNQGGETNNPK